MTKKKRSDIARKNALSHWAKLSAKERSAIANKAALTRKRRAAARKAVATRQQRATHN